MDHRRQQNHHHQIENKIENESAIADLSRVFGAIKLFQILRILECLLAFEGVNITFHGLQPTANATVLFKGLIHGEDPAVEHNVAMIIILLTEEFESDQSKNVL